MKTLMMLAASRSLTPTCDSSSAISDSVLVSRDASKTMLLVAPSRDGEIKDREQDKRWHEQREPNAEVGPDPAGPSHA